MRLQRAVPDLTVDDVQAAVRRYTGIFGLRVLMDHGWIATLGDRDGVAQFSVMSRDATAPENPAMSLEVEDVDAAWAAAREHGLEIVHVLTDEPWGVRRFFFRDPDGTVVNVLAHTGQPPIS